MENFIFCVVIALLKRQKSKINSLTNHSGGNDERNRLSSVLLESLQIQERTDMKF